MGSTPSREKLPMKATATLGYIASEAVSRNGQLRAALAATPPEHTSRGRRTPPEYQQPPEAAVRQIDKFGHGPTIARYVVAVGLYISSGGTFLITLPAQLPGFAYKARS
jgi:hypothetical protein